MTHLLVLGTGASGTISPVGATPRPLLYPSKFQPPTSICHRNRHWVQNAWGLTRILGELRKLNIKSVSRNTVKNILKANGLDPGPQRGVGTWDEFLKLHAATLWQCDFLSVRTLTTKGIRELYLLVFLHVESRRVFVTPATYHPNEAWVCDQAMAFAAHAEETGLGAAVLMHDRDGKFMRRFDE